MGWFAGNGLAVGVRTHCMDHRVRARSLGSGVGMVIETSSPWKGRGRGEDGGIFLPAARRRRDLEQSPSSSAAGTAEGVGRLPGLS